MFSKISAALTALVFLQSTVAQSTSSTYSADQSTSTACPSSGGAHIIVARGSLEAAPYGILVEVKDGVLAQVPGSTADGAVGYPDTLADYQNSETAGAIIARQLITNFTSSCPGLPLVVMGYSQGAQVLGDALVGQVDKGFDDNSTVDTPLPNSVLSQVAAVILMGDPTFNTTETFHVGNATLNGDFPRSDVSNWDNAGLASRTQSYCDADDLFCASGKSLAVHVGYVAEYGDAAVAYVVEAIAAWYASNSSSGSSTTTTATTTASASASVKSKSASASASASASKVSACMSAASGTGRRTGTGSASASAALRTASASSSTSSTATVSSGAASSLNLGAAAGAGAVAAGLFAAML